MIECVNICNIKLTVKNISIYQIKAIVRHKSNSSIKSYVERPTLKQFKKMSTLLRSFIQCEKKVPNRQKHQPI